MIRRPPRSTLSSSSAASDVYKRQGRLARRAGACHPRRRVDRRRARARLRGDPPMRLGSDHVRVRVPATSANLGPGFDSMGIALAHYDTIEIRALGSPEVTVEVFGEGAGELPTGEDHLIVRAIRAALDDVGAPQVQPVSYTHLRAHETRH